MSTVLAACVVLRSVWCLIFLTVVYFLKFPFYRVCCEQGVLSGTNHLEK